MIEGFKSHPERLYNEVLGALIAPPEPEEEPEELEDAADEPEEDRP